MEVNTVDYVRYVITNEVGRHRYSDCSLFRAEFKIDNNNSTSSASANDSATNTTHATSVINRTVPPTTTTK